MIISVNPKPSMQEFADLMRRTDILLNKEALSNPEYYKRRGGSPLEDDVKVVLDECAKGTTFAGTIEKISGQRFPDIVAAKFYGVEVKSTKEDHWTSTGSSILESSRVQDVERIYMTFGKLGGQVQFLSRPYEECLYDIKATHMPRYVIDMKLKPGHTIFDKMGIPYDTLRQMKDPVRRVSEYYRSNLKPGESLWWIGGAEDSPSVIRPWDALSILEKRTLVTYGFVNYPEIFMGDYNRYTLWLTLQQSVINPHVRDCFTAGGVKPVTLLNGEVKDFPAIYNKLNIHFDAVAQCSATRFLRNSDRILEKKAPVLRNISEARSLASAAPKTAGRPTQEGGLFRLREGRLLPPLSLPFRPPGEVTLPALRPGLLRAPGRLHWPLRARRTPSTRRPQAPTRCRQSRTSTSCRCAIPSRPCCMRHALRGAVSTRGTPRGGSRSVSTWKGSPRASGSARRR